MNNLAFLREAARSFRDTGAVARSSRFLVDRMLRRVDFTAPGLHVLEYGTGEGCITREILEQLPPDGRLTAFELNPVFAERIASMNHPSLRTINGGAQLTGRYVEPASVDYIVSSLPLSNIPDAVKKLILNEAKRALKPGGLFVQYQYALQDYQLIREHFSEVDLSFTLLNLPPAFVYECC